MFTFESVNVGPFFPTRSYQGLSNKANVRPSRPQFQMYLHAGQVEVSKVSFLIISYWTIVSIQSWHFLSLTHKFMFNPCWHNNLFQGTDEDYDKALLNYYEPYHRLIDRMCRMAINLKILNADLITLCML